MAEKKKNWIVVCFSTLLLRVGVRRLRILKCPFSEFAPPLDRGRRSDLSLGHVCGTQALHTFAGQGDDSARHCVKQVCVILNSVYEFIRRVITHPRCGVASRGCLAHTSHFYSMHIGLYNSRKPHFWGKNPQMRSKIHSQIEICYCVVFV
jgi:hypothetical protein